MDRKFNKFIPNTQMLTFHALKHSLSSAANWSSALGGPRISTIKRACKPRINILPFIDSENLAAHIRQYKEILKKYNNVSDFSKVPLQVSFDATAVTGRFQSRKLQSRCSDNVDRIIYGVTTPSGPLQKTLINVETCDGRKHVAQDKSCICINGMENTLDLVEEGAISRAKSYMSIVLLALIPDSRPYCVGMYSVTKGTYSFALSTAHREVVNAVKEAGLHVVTLPGDGDVTLRPLQWGFYTCQRYNWFTELIVPLDLFYDSNGEYPIFGLQDPLHVLKKLRNNVKRLETFHWVKIKRWRRSL